jgi:hypothetical protein
MRYAPAKDKWAYTGIICMITGMGTVSIYIENQQKSLKFWTERVGFEVRANNP